MMSDMQSTLNPICSYYHKLEDGGECWAQKHAPRVDCQGIYNRTHCEIYEDFLENNETTEKEMVNHPQHYNNGGIECIDALAAATEGLQGIEAFCTANAIKYLWRWKWKNGKEDLDKAIWYIEHLKKSLANPD